jgi:S-adenosylmethionine:tRNA ribosyltransferase-isomerase
MLVSDFDFWLPPELIAQSPPSERDGARLLTLDRKTGKTGDAQFRDFPEMLRPGDLLILNDSRVIPARLFARRVAHEEEHPIEVFLTEQIDEWTWRTLTKPARKLKAGTELRFDDPTGRERLTAHVISLGEFGERTVRFAATKDFYGELEAIGHIPLPPYIHREDSITDRERYQTIYAAERGSAAAPTAGLHFTPQILERLRARDVEIAYVTLHVGLGTFQPLRATRLADVRLHAEHYNISMRTADALNNARREGRRVVGIGTTAVRTLEHCARMREGAEIVPHSGSTNLFLSPGAEFQIVQAMLTNFHLPQSSLLMLVCAFGGYAPVMHAYEHAVEQRYRFFSYGDAMFLS